MSGLDLMTGKKDEYWWMIIAPKTVPDVLCCHQVVFCRDSEGTYTFSDGTTFVQTGGTLGTGRNSNHQPQNLPDIWNNKLIFGTVFGSTNWFLDQEMLLGALPSLHGRSNISFKGMLSFKTNGKMWEFIPLWRPPNVNFQLREKLLLADFSQSERKGLFLKVI